MRAEEDIQMVQWASTATWPVTDVGIKAKNQGKCTIFKDLLYENILKLNSLETQFKCQVCHYMTCRLHCDDVKKLSLSPCPFLILSLTHKLVIISK